MTCGGCWMATPHPAVFAASTSSSSQVVTDGNDAWVGGCGAVRPGRTGAAEARQAFAGWDRRRGGPSRRAGGRVVWVNGRSRPWRVMARLHRSFPSASSRMPGRPAAGHRAPAWPFTRPPCGCRLARARNSRRYSAEDVAASILLVATPPTTDVSNACRIPRRSGRRFPRHPENRRPTRTVLAAHRRYPPLLRSATHRR
jgi:hypothetical protein